MSILSNIFAFFNTPKREVQGYAPGWSGANMQPFDGEKTPFELGTPLHYSLDYYGIRMRAWENYIKSDIVQNAIKKYVLWIVGAGLKIQVAPVDSVINDKSFNNKTFAKTSEPLFRLFANSRQSTYNNMNTLHDAAAEALKNAILAGDVLCVLRFENNLVTIQIIDGHFVQSPLMKTAANGNRIIQGVEVDGKGKHIAYYIAKPNFEFERVPAYGDKTGRLQAWLFYGMRHKNDDVRGMSLLTAVMETAAKIDRYKEATVGTAEENAKLVYSIEHDQNSDGSNPLIKNLAQSMGRNNGTAPETDPQTAGENVATKIALSTEKQVFNMPIGAKINQHGGKVDIHFGEFFSTNADLIYATLGIPPEVAMDKFGGAYSGSRAALKSWEYKMAVDRITLLDRQFYKPFYSYWLDIQVLSNKITVPGYLEAMLKKDYTKIEAYKNVRFVGAGVPHIDPLKEVNAERKKLGSIYDNVPLTTGDNSAETLGTGDFESILEQAARERELFSEFENTNENENGL